MKQDSSTCKYGHANNWYVTNSGSRQCRDCRTEAVRRHRGSSLDLPAKLEKLEARRESLVEALAKTVLDIAIVENKIEAQKAKVD